MQKLISLISANKTLIIPSSSSYHLSSYLPSNLTFFPSSSPLLNSNTLFQKHLFLSSSSTPSFAAAASSNITHQHQSLSDWEDFTTRVSGEWDGFGVEFSAEGKPVELPEFVVPNAFREWEVEVFDWQTQCPTLASGTIDPLFFYKHIKLLPTVGCEADAATRYSVDERIAGGSENNAAVFGFHRGGRYICVWGKKGVMELEHCLVNSKNWEERIRVIQVVGIEEGVVSLERIWVFSEHWDGDFRNGEQLGGCAIKDTGFALSKPVEASEIWGEWEGIERFSVGGLEDEQKALTMQFPIHQLVKGQPQKSIRGQIGLIALPKNLWCSLKVNDNGETLAEVGWLVDHGQAMTSLCVLHSDGRIKEMVIGEEAKVLDYKAK